VTVSVVIPTFDEERAISEAISRLLAETPPPEVIVSDGGSRDGTVECARRAGCRVVVGPRGRGTQMNRGAAVARGDAFVFLHADCALDPGALGEIEDVLADPRVAAAAFRQSIGGGSRAYRWIERAADFRARRLRTIYGDSGLAVRRDLFLRVGGYPDVPLFEDIGMSRRLRAVGEFRVVSRRIHVSPRRWEREGIVHATIRNWWITARFLLGESEESLARYYLDAR
jgi:rSAM/selenodomain-associated transferase 2